MSFRIERPQADFTIVCNSILRDARLSLRAKGLYALMFSKPNDWIFHEAALMTEFTDGRDALRATFRELIATGWLTKLQPRQGGKFEHNVYRLTVDWKSVDGRTVDGKSTPNNTDISKTDKKRERAQSLEAFLEGKVANSSGCPVGWWGWAEIEFGWGWERLKRVFDTFRDYWRSKAGKDALKADWEATWRNWCRREGSFGKQKPLQKGEIRVRETTADEIAHNRFNQEIMRLRKLPENLRKSDDEIAKLASAALYGDA